MTQTTLLPTARSTKATTSTGASIRAPRVAEMPAQERPAVRVREHGATRCSTLELLATILGGADALTIAHKVLAAYGNDPRDMLSESAAQLKRKADLSEKDATRLHAALELGRRIAATPASERPSVRAPSDVYHHMRHLEDAQVEQFHVLILDAQHKVKRDVCVTTGILNSSLVHPREVFKEAIAERAAAIILVHNHPSGDPTPSQDDCVITQQLVAAGQLLDIPVHDHVIVGRGRYTSFAEQGLM